MAEVVRGYRALLRLRPARLLAIASVPADFADWLDYTAIIALLVFTYDAGPWAMAFFAFSLVTPAIIVGPALAVYVDKWPLKRVLVLSNLGRALTTAFLILTPPPVFVIAAAFLRGTVDSAFNPARQAAIQATTPKELLGEANGLHQAINQVSKIAGPTLGGLLLVFLTPQLVFGINTVMSLIAVAILTITPVARAVGGLDVPESFRTRLFAGLAEFRAKAELRQALIFAAVAFFAFFLYDALIALLIDDLGMDAGLFGIAVATAGAGGLIGGLVGGRLSFLRPLRVMVGAALVSAIVTIGLASLVLYGFAVPPPLFLAAMLVMGGSTSFMMIPYRVLIQRDVEPSRVGRVVATGESVITAVMVGAPFLGALIASIWGVPAAFLAGGLVLLALALVSVARRRGT
ncbi:MAG: MFS transporter [Alphaproteobacteria bacterium]|nr:MFS transporter [Alphaproteobacteria bacterium]